jgi:adenylate kinase family enzyme
MNTNELAQYAQAVEALAPVLYDLPGKLVVIDGRPGSGKTTLGRYLAWRFNVSLLEADLFLFEGRGSLTYRTDEINRIIEFRLKKPRPIIVESVAALRLMKAISHKPDFLINVSNISAPESRTLKNEIESYEAEFSPRSKADLVIEIDV